MMVNYNENKIVRIKVGIGTGFSGNAGGMIFFDWKGIQAMRAAFARSKKSSSKKQVLHRQRFKTINEYCAKYKYTLIPQIWNLAAENRHGYNLFVKANYSVFPVII
jgi:hypothetical protein